jgi:quercetin dioxygenase-like cupin family protein
MSSQALLPDDKSAGLVLAEAVPSIGQGIVSRTVLSAPGLRAVLFSFAAGQELTEHTSGSRALIQVLSGSCEFSVEGRPRVLDAGELLHLPPRVPHALKAREPMIMLLILAPGPAATEAPL